MVRMKVTIEKEIEHYDIWSWLVGAFEGGSGYWASTKSTNTASCTRVRHSDPRIVAENKRRKGDKTYIPWRQEAQNDFEWLKENKIYVYQHQLPFLGGEVTVYDRETDKELGVLNMETIERGLNIMQERYSRHFDDFLTENGDAITSDVMFQCMVMGEIVFG